MDRELRRRQRDTARDPEDPKKRAAPERSARRAPGGDALSCAERAFFDGLRADLLEDDGIDASIRVLLAAELVAFARALTPLLRTDQRAEPLDQIFALDLSTEANRGERFRSGSPRLAAVRAVQALNHEQRRFQALDLCRQSLSDQLEAGDRLDLLTEYDAFLAPIAEPWAEQARGRFLILALQGHESLSTNDAMDLRSVLIPQLIRAFIDPRWRRFLG